MGETAQTFSVRIGGNGRSSQRQRRLLACAGGVHRTRGEVGRRFESEPPRHAESHLIMRSLERPEQGDAFPTRRLSQLLIQCRERQSSFLRKGEIGRVIGREPMRNRKGENRAVRARSGILERQPSQPAHRRGRFAGDNASAPLGHDENIARLMPERRRDGRSPRQRHDYPPPCVAVLLGEEPGRRDRGIDYDGHTPRAPSRFHARISSRVTGFDRARAARASARTAARSFALSIRVSLAIGTSPRAMVISSPASTLARRSERWVFASPTLTMVVMDSWPSGGERARSARSFKDRECRLPAPWSSAWPIGSGEPTVALGRGWRSANAHRVPTRTRITWVPCSWYRRDCASRVVYAGIRSTLS